MTRVFIELWPALLPIGLYLLWHHTQRRKAKKSGKDSPHLKDGPWVSTLLISIAIAIGCLLLFALSQPADKGEYVPAQLQDGTLIDGQLTQ